MKLHPNQSPLFKTNLSVSLATQLMDYKFQPQLGFKSLTQDSSGFVFGPFISSSAETSTQHRCFKGTLVIFNLKQSFSSGLLSLHCVLKCIKWGNYAIICSSSILYLTMHQRLFPPDDLFHLERSCCLLSRSEFFKAIMK